MKRSGVLMAAAALGAMLAASGPADAFRGGGGFHGGGFGGFHGGFGGWHGGWGHGGWGRGGWGWNRWGWNGGGWGWNNGWGWSGDGWPAYAALAGVGLGLAAASSYPYWGYDYPNYAYDYAPAYGAAPLVTGRSVATGQFGNFCTTPAKTCELYHASFLGNGCSCRVPGGHARGSVTP